MLLRILLLFSVSLLYSINPPKDMDFPIGFWDEMRLQDIGSEYGDTGWRNKMTAHDGMRDAQLTFNIPVLLGKYSDATTYFTASDFQNMLFDNNSTGSMKEYYTEISYGNFTVDGTAGGWYQSTYTMSDAKSNTKLYVSEIAELADPDFDYSQFDNDGPDNIPNSGDDDGYVDGIAVVYSGCGAEWSPGNNNLWPHMSSLGSTYQYTTGDVSANGGYVIVNSYFVSPELSGGGDCNTTTIRPMGVYAHEFGHILGLPDLYDRDDSNGDSEGIGNWCLMAGGSWNGTGGDTPAHLSAWCKQEMGWLEPTVLIGDEDGVSIPQAETNAFALKIWEDDYQWSRYFLVENRQQTGFDAELPGNGLMIYHVDENKRWGSNRWSSGSVNNDHTHKFVDVEEADGDADMDNGVNRGDDGDTFPGSTNNTSFSNTSNPNSNRYDGSTTTISVTNISSSSISMTADITLESIEGIAIAYDSAGISGWGYGYSNAQESWGGVLFQYPSSVTTPGYLTEVDIGFRNADNFYTLYVYDALGPNGTNYSPGNLLLETTGTLTTSGWASVAVDSILIQPGQEFFVAVMQNDAYAVSYDRVTTAAERSYFSGNGTSYSDISYNNNGLPRNINIRAKISNNTTTTENLTYVPDDNFEQALIDLGYDDVLDNYVVTDSISGVTSLDVGEKEISDLTGIEAFIALTQLYCDQNQLTDLDVSNNTSLAYLICHSNQLTSLDVSANTALTYLTCAVNQLTTLDVSNNTALTHLVCSNNLLTALDVSANTALTSLSCSVNSLTALDVSANTDLTELSLMGNELTTLDVSAHTALTYFRCQNNQLTTLNMRNGVTDSLTTFNAYNNPNLTCIETLDPDYATENWTNANGNIDEGVTFSVICGSEEQDVWHVATTGSDGSGNGTQESPFATIQKGINAAGDGNTVHVAAGTYVENINYNGKNITVLGENRETTIIDGGGVSNVVRFENDENEQAVLSGFTLTNGRGVQEYTYGRGGGICNLSSPTLSDLTIIGNTALGGGGGMYIHSTSSSIITDVDIIDNITEAWRGGGIYYYGGNATLSNMKIIGNQAGNGGGIGFQNVTNLAMDNIVISENTASEGAGIVLNGGNFEFGNLTIVGNASSNGSSGGIMFADNYGYVSELILSSSIVYDNSGDHQIIFEPNSDPHAITVRYSNIQDSEDAILTNDNGTITWGDGNIDADPLFCEADSGNYLIAGNSPCAGTGQDGADMGALGVGCGDIWFPPTIATMADTSMDEDSELMLQLSAESEQGYDIYFEAESDTSSVYVYTEDDMLHINLETDWNGSSQITVMAYSEFDYEISNTTSFTLTVNPVNDEPMFHNLHALVGAGMEFHVPIHVYDIDMDSLVVTFDQSWEYPEWLSLDDNPYALTGTAPEPGSIHFPLQVTDAEVTITDTFHLTAQFFSPRITSVTDVPEDQGGRVYVSFLKSFFDLPDGTNQMYTVFRHDIVDNAPDWVVVGSGAAIGEGSYTYEVSTLMDSTAEGDAMTEFKVVASMDEGHFHSDPAMGYSTDDIAPGVPQGLMAVVVNEGIQLTWEMSADEDFQYFMLEKSSDEAFTEPEVFETIDIAYLDLDYVLNESNYYRIAAVDHAGNISDYSDVVDITVLAIDLDLIPEVFALHQNYPNPFNPTTRIKYDLPEDAMVSITIYDAMGRRVKSLVNTTQSAGYRSIQWNATNSLGEPVSAGMYIYMIQAGKFRQTKKMVLLK